MLTWLALPRSYVQKGYNFSSFSAAKLETAEMGSVIVIRVCSYRVVGCLPCSEQWAILVITKVIYRVCQYRGNAGSPHHPCMTYSNPYFGPHTYVETKKLRDCSIDRCVIGGFKWNKVVGSRNVKNYIICELGHTTHLRPKSFTLFTGVPRVPGLSQVLGAELLPWFR